VIEKKLHILFLFLLSMAGCASRQAVSVSGLETTAYQDSVQVDLDLPTDDQVDLRAARWYLLRATEAQAFDLFEQARQDLDKALHILAALETDDAMPESGRAQREALSTSIESLYFKLLPHLEHFSDDIPLSLLLQGFSEEQLDNLPQEAAPLVHIHRLRQHCDVPIDANARVAASIHFFQTRGRETYATWLKRSGRYRAMILNILKEEGVPQDLFYIAMIESGFNPRAYSRAQAVGLWQFIESTGKLEGLDRNHWIDERRDPVKSTRAAARHLKKLHHKFQDWRLAAAAYNAGSGRVTRAIERAGSRNFWNLELPRETTNYVPLFMAATIISKDPKLFGFDEIEPDPPLEYSEVKIKNPVRLKAAARCAQAGYEELRDLNPELRRIITPPRATGSYHLRIPPGKSRAFFACYNKLPESERLAWHYYYVQRNDSIWSISLEFGISSELIIEANSLKNPDRIRQGQRLYIPSLAGFEGRPVNGKNYTVKPGDSLSRIAQQHGVSVAQLRAWNQLGGDIIHPGKTLKVQSVKTQPRPAKQPDLNGKDRPLHIVQTGETLWGIGNRFAVDVENIKRWNQLSGSLIRPGQKLLVGPPNPNKGSLYTVAEGDTLYSIAQKFGLQVEQLARQNKISLSSTLLSGMTLKIKPLN
jgi:membrane-bound lytic murein transglycosylase D